MISRKQFIRFNIFLLIAILTLPLTSYLLTGSGNVIAAEQEQTENESVYWEQLRLNQKGYSAVSGRETDELIQSTGKIWRDLRRGPVSIVGALFIAVTVFGLLAFYLYRGQVKLSHPKTGKTVVRWNKFERYLHWFTAVTFIILMITGLSLLYGRTVLIPLLGHEGFSNYASLAKLLHNYIGLLFMAGLLLMIVLWIKHNLPDKTDIQWFLQFGGMIGDKHPSAKRMNAGEKGWFWTLFFAGTAVVVSGLILDFPNFDQERELLQFAHITHVVLGIVLIAFSFGHIYIGTIGTEGALEGMVTGHVDTTWAKQHHDLWYAELEEKDTNDPGENSG